MKYTSKSIRLGHAESSEAWLELEGRPGGWGEPITGALVLRSHGVPHRVTDTVLASLDLSSDDEHRLLASQALCAGGFVLGAGESRRLPLCLEMPWATPFDCSVVLVVTVRSGVWNQSVRAAIQVTPPLSFVEHAEQFAQCAKMAVRRWEYGPEGAFTAETVPAVKPHPFRLARLTLHRVDDDWYGELRLYLKERAGWLLAASPAAILDTPRSPVVIGVPFLSNDPERAQEALGSLLRSAGYEPRRDPVLPLPAEAAEPLRADLPTPSRPASAETSALPRPSGDTEV